MRAGSTPTCAPSRAMSVTIKAATSAARKRSAASATVSWLVSTHPLTASLPSRISIDPKTLPGNSTQALAEQFWIQQRSRTDRDAVGAARERRAYRFDCAQSAAHIDCAFYRRSNLRDRFDISRRSGNRAIEIHYVDKFRPGFLEATRRIARVCPIDGGLAHVAMQQANDLAALQVNRGNDGELLEQADYSNSDSTERALGRKHA